MPSHDIQFQKDLIVWKPSDGEEIVCPQDRVSEGLNSVETFSYSPHLISPPHLVSEGLNSVETNYFINCFNPKTPDKIRFRF